MFKHARKEGSDAPGASALKVVAVYALCAGAWIVFSDRLLGLLLNPAEIGWYQTIKGLFFIIFTSFLLFLMIRSYATRQRQYRTFMENVQDVVFTHDLDGIITYLNAAFETTTGWSRREWVGTPFHALIHPDDLPRALELVQLVGSGESFRMEELRVRSRDGAWLTGEFTAVPQLQDGRVLGVLGVVRDVTGRRVAENALRESCQRMKAILDVIPDIAWFKDPEGRYQAVNGAFMRACGLAHEEIAGRTDLEIWAPDLARTCRENDARALASGDLTVVEEELELYDGARVWIETIRVPVVGERGEVVGTAGIARNITARRQAEEALRQREERYRQLFVQSQDALILFRQGSGEIIEVNSRACELYGRIREEFVSSGLSLILPPRVGAAHGELSSFIRNGATFLRDKVRSVRRDGTELYVSVRGKGIRIGGEAVVCCSFREVPEELRPSP